MDCFAVPDIVFRLNAIATDRSEPFLQYYGGKISSEWLIPKVWQILNETPDIYHATSHFIEGGDWVTFQLTGALKHSSCASGYKHTWIKKFGYPSKDFFKALDPRFENFVEEKLSAPIAPIGSKIGELTVEAAKLIGLKHGTAVAVSIIDAHASLPAVGIAEPGKLLAIMGTSTCHIVLDENERTVPGTCVVEDGVVPGYYAYEAGQACVGDHFKWFIENCVPGMYVEGRHNFEDRHN